MNLRELLKKAKNEDDPVKRLHNKAAFLKALDNCAEELLSVVEAAEKAKLLIDDYLNPRTNTGLYSERYEKNFLYAQSELEAALARLKEKEGKP